MQKQEFITKKSERTFDIVIAVATDLFRTKGFHQTTMRDISRQSGLALGALYYYFKSKEELVLIFYERINEQISHHYHSQVKEPQKLPEAFAAFMQLKLVHLEPYRDLMRVVMKEAIDPESPLSPLSRESARPLALSTNIFVELVEQTGAGKGEEAQETGRALWLVHMLLLTFWLHDRSVGTKATHQITETFASILRLSSIVRRIPGVGGIRKKLFVQLNNFFLEQNND